MEALAIVLVLILGLIFGSFLNVCIARLPRHESIVRPGSHCPRCGAAVPARDNVPVISFLLLGGRCRSCRQPISWRYPAVELALAALWLLCWLKYGPTIEALGMAILSFLLLGLAAMDAETLSLPNSVTLPGVVLGIIYSGAVCGPSIWSHVRCALLSAVWAAAASGILLAISGIYWLLRRRMGMGIGDAKLMALIAAWLGPAPALLVLFLASLTAAVFGIGMGVVRGRLDDAEPLPFGSFLSAAGLYAAFHGQAILAWYMRFFR